MHGPLFKLVELKLLIPGENVLHVHNAAGDVIKSASVNAEGVIRSGDKLFSNVSSLVNSVLKAKAPWKQVHYANTTLYDLREQASNTITNSNICRNVPEGTPAGYEKWKRMVNKCVIERFSFGFKGK